jgi:hypothetical protein
LNPLGLKLLHYIKLEFLILCSEIELKIHKNCKDPKILYFHSLTPKIPWDQNLVDCCLGSLCEEINFFPIFSFGQMNYIFCKLSVNTKHIQIQRCLLWRDRAKSRRNVMLLSQRRVASLWRIATLLLQWGKLVTVRVVIHDGRGRKPVV